MERPGCGSSRFADPTRPAKVGYYHAPSMADGVAVTGDHVYVADHFVGLQKYQFCGG
jgi:hypothetical protein